MSTPVPPKPVPPNPQDCCDSGCTLCVYTVYDEELARWREAVKAASQGPAQPTDGPTDGSG